jgi:hypothetical protein
MTFQAEALAKLRTISDYTAFTGSEIEMLFDNFRQSLGLDFSSKLSNISKLSDKECQQLTGLTKSQFNSLESKLKTLKNSVARDKSQALATYLFWLKTGLPYRTIATLFSFDNYRVVGHYCE